LGLSRATVYRRLSKLESTGIEVRRASERVTLVDEADPDRYMMGEGRLPEGEMRARLDALEEARCVRTRFRRRYGTLPAGEIARAVRELRGRLGK